MIRAVSEAPSTEQNKRPPRTVRKRRSLWRTLGILGLLVLVVAVLLVTVPTTRWVQGTGYITTDHEVELRPSVEGAIGAWLVHTGDTVEANQLLIQLNNSVQKADYEQAISEQKAKEAELTRLMDAQQLERAQRKEQIARAEENLKLAQSYYERMSDGGFSTKEVEEARMKVELARSQLAELKLPHDPVMESQLVVLREQIESSRRAVAAHAAQMKLREVRAPLKGLVQLNRYEPGEVVKPDHVLGQVFDMDTWVIKMTLPEESLPHVKEGQHVLVAPATYSTLRWGYIDATVTRIMPVVTPRQTGNGVYLVEATLKMPSDRKIKPGMTATAYVDAGRVTWAMRLLGW